MKRARQASLSDASDDAVDFAGSSELARDVEAAGSSKAARDDDGGAGAQEDARPSLRCSWSIHLLFAADLSSRRSSDVHQSGGIDVAHRDIPCPRLLGRRLRARLPRCALELGSLAELAQTIAL